LHTALGEAAQGIDNAMLEAGRDADPNFYVSIRSRGSIASARYSTRSDGSMTSRGSDCP
jgi:hypothetical protein